MVPGSNLAGGGFVISFLPVAGGRDAAVEGGVPRAGERGHIIEVRIPLLKQQHKQQCCLAVVKICCTLEHSQNIS